MPWLLLLDDNKAFSKLIINKKWPKCQFLGLEWALKPASPKDHFNKLLNDDFGPEKAI